MLKQTYAGVFKRWMKRFLRLMPETGEIFDVAVVVIVSIVVGGGLGMLFFMPNTSFKGKLSYWKNEDCRGKQTIISLASVLCTR